MRYFENARTVIFENLDNLIDKDGRRVYSEELLQNIKSGDFNYLNTIDSHYKNDIFFMEPLLYAVKNSEYNTYAIYKYYGEELQEDINIAAEIVKEEPELIEGTSASNSEAFILEMAKVNPEVILYMSESLKENTEFAEQLCDLNNEDITMYVAKECTMPNAIIENPSLGENKSFMIEAAKEDPKVLEYASDEFKDDYKFMREVSKNKETIDYVIEHIEDFGEKGLSGTKDALVEISSDEAICGFEEEQKNVKKQIEEKADDNTELEGLLKRDKQLQRHIKFFEKIKNGEVDSVRAAKLIDKICVNLDEKYKEEIKQVLKLDEAIIEKQKLNENKDIQEEKIGLENIERKTESASLEGIKEETHSIRKGIEEERTSGMGENINEQSNDERV